MLQPKKAQFVQENIGKIILILIGLTIILFYLSKIYLAYDASTEVCQQSVNIRATLPSIGKDISPLKCQTQKYCFISSSGDCKETWGDAKDVVYVKVKSKLDIEKFIAEKMVSCNKMMGEGKYNLFGESYFSISAIEPTCVVCSRFAFNFPSLAKQNINFNDINVMQYMASYRMPDSQISYLNYFSESSGKANADYDINFQAIADQIKEVKESIGNEDLSESEKQEAGMQLEKIILDFEEAEKNKNQEKQFFQSLTELESQKELSIIFMQITAPSYGDVVKNDLTAAGIGAGGSIAVFGGGNTLKGATWLFFKNNINLKNIASMLLRGKVGWSQLKDYFKVGKGGKLAAATIALAIAGQAVTSSRNQMIASTYCSEFGVGDEIRYGCSATKLIYYNQNGLNSMCSVIESHD